MFPVSKRVFPSEGHVHPDHLKSHMAYLSQPGWHLLWWRLLGRSATIFRDRQQIYWLENRPSVLHLCTRSLTIALT